MIGGLVVKKGQPCVRQSRCLYFVGHAAAAATAAGWGRMQHDVLHGCGPFHLMLPKLEVDVNTGRLLLL